MELLEGFSKLVWDFIGMGFHRSRKKDYFRISSKKPAKYVKTISAHSKSAVLIF
jgi:hypothetical protein